MVMRSEGFRAEDGVSVLGSNSSDTVQTVQLGSTPKDHPGPSLHGVNSDREHSDFPDSAPT